MLTLLRSSGSPWRSLLPSVQSKILALVWLLNIGTIFQDYYGETPVGAPEIPTAVAALESVVKIVYPVNVLGPIRLLEFVRDAIALGVRHPVRCDASPLRLCSSSPRVRRMSPRLARVDGPLPVLRSAKIARDASDAGCHRQVARKPDPACGRKDKER